MAARREGGRAQGWWGRRWLEYLEREHGVSLSSAEAGRARRALVAVTFLRGVIEARVQRGPSGKWEWVQLRVKPLTRPEWDRFLRVLVGNPELAGSVLAGTPGPELEERLRAHRVELFPPPARLRALRCSCRESRGWTCAHIRVLAAHAADLLDGNPFLWFEVLGRPRAELFAQVRAGLADAAPARPAGARAGGSGGSGEVSLSAGRFWETPVDPASIPVRPGRSSAAGALVRSLGALPLPDEAQEVLLKSAPPAEAGAAPAPFALRPARTRLSEALRQYAGHVSRQAAALATGDAAPVHRPAPLPGQPLPAGERLAMEVAGVLREREEVLDIGTLRDLCPTAAAASGPDGLHLVEAALSHLPPDLMVLAGTYAGTRSAVLMGATFRHVVTFEEWNRGDLSLDSDWARALRLAGAEPPYVARAEGRSWAVGGAETAQGPGLLAALDAEPGDEVQLTVADTSPLLVEAQLVPRAKRNPAELDVAAERAAGLLREHLEFQGARRISETDAVALLLALGLYRGGAGPDDLWLLPTAASGLYREAGAQRLPGERGLTLADPGWWALGGFRLLHASDGECTQRLLQDYAVRSARWGRDPRHVQGGYSLVQRWTTVWAPPHDDPERAPGIAHFLRFLWVEAPRLSRTLRLPSEAALQALAEWLDLLVEHRPELRDHYRPHAAACRLVAAFDHRRRTFPYDRRPVDPAIRSWEAEGHRWIGPALVGGGNGR